MERYPPIPPDKLTPEQREIHDAMLEGAGMTFGKMFIYQRGDGALVGPFAPLMYTPPAVARSFFGAAIAIGQIPNFPSSAKEAVILTTGALFQCQYERYAHKHVAEKTGALTAAQVKELAQGRKPADADDAVATAYDVTMGLVEQKGPLEEALFQRARKQFGNDGTLALIHYAGLYCYTCVILNGADVPIPKP